eukprot:6520767-Lingulodinium_polyedra.AAC.1
MRRDFAAYQEAQNHAEGDVFWKRRLERSCFQLPIVEVVFAHASSAQFAAVTPAMATTCRAAFACIGQTKVIEDHFGKARDAETRGAKHKKMGPSRLWSRLLSSGTLHDEHQFDSLAT